MPTDKPLSTQIRDAVACPTCQASATVPCTEKGRPRDARPVTWVHLERINYFARQARLTAHQQPEETPMHGYIAFVEGKRHEIHAASLADASRQARALYTGRKKHPSISVNLVELNGEQITTVITN